MKMVVNDWENGLNGPNSSKSLPNCPKISQNVPRCPKMSQNVPKCSLQTHRCPNGLVSSKSAHYRERGTLVKTHGKNPLGKKTGRRRIQSEFLSRFSIFWPRILSSIFLIDIKYLRDCNFHQRVVGRFTQLVIKTTSRPSTTPPPQPHGHIWIKSRTDETGEGERGRKAFKIYTVHWNGDDQFCLILAGCNNELCGFYGIWWVASYWADYRRIPLTAHTDQWIWLYEVRRIK